MKYPDASARSIAAAISNRASAKKAVERVTGVDPLLQYGVPARSKPIYPPPGIHKDDFNTIVEGAILHYALSGGLDDITPQTVRPYCAGKQFSLEFITKVMASKPFYNTMALRGVTLYHKDSEGNTEADRRGLSGEQMRALSVVMDVSHNMSFERKLKKAGVTSYQWQSWLNDPQFRAYHDKLASTLFDKVQADVDAQIASGALDGKLDFIKYFNEVSGRFDPKKRAHQDIQQLLNDVVDIVMRNVKDSDTLSRISSELSAAVAKLG